MLAMCQCDFNVFTFQMDNGIANCFVCRLACKKIEQSIVRIDAGDYGYCDETGEPIGVGRLLARPTATLSLEAQQRRELKQKMFGD